MSVEGEVYSESGEPVDMMPVDSDWRQIALECEALDQFLRVQNLRRSEEEYLVELLEGRRSI